MRKIDKERKLGRLGFDRLQLLGLVNAGSHVSYNKEQLREVEKEMIKLGWDGKAHTITCGKDGFRLSKEPVSQGHIIRVKPFKLDSKIRNF